MTNTTSLIVLMLSRLTSLSVHISGDSLMYVKMSNFEYKKNLSKSVLSTFKIIKNPPQSRHLHHVASTRFGFLLSCLQRGGMQRDVARSSWRLLGEVPRGGKRLRLRRGHRQGEMLWLGLMLYWMRTILMFVL